MSHILIIGAGASGLMAAKNLLEKGHTVTIIEARDRIGGRVHTLTNGFSIPTEAGAEFVHGQKPFTMELLIESKNKVSLLEGKHYQFWDGKLQKGNVLDGEWGKLLRQLKKLEHDTDMNTFLNEHFREDKYSELRERVKGFVEGYDAADLDRVSAMALKEEWEQTDDEHQYHIHGGYITLMNYFHEKITAAGGTVFLSSPVKEIQWSPGNATIVTTTGNKISGDKVIITVPLGVLQKGAIQFTPALPEHTIAFHQMGFGGVIKFMFEFHIAFWENRIKEPFKKVGFMFTDAGVPTWWSQLPDKTPILTGWQGGPQTFTGVHNSETLRDKAIASLQYIFNCSTKEITDQIKHYHIADWTTDPYSYGAYAYVTTETQQALTLLSTPVNNTVYFAGEALYQGPHTGTVEAALLSGRDVSAQI